MSKQKFDSVVLDTINQIQNDLYVKLLKMKGKATYDEWKDYGVEILDLLYSIKEMGAIPVLILGFEGTGKTMGARFLDPSKTLYINGDKKPLTFKDRSGYVRGTNYAEPKTYEDVKKLIKLAADTRDKDDAPLVVFIMGHIEVYRGSNDEQRERLKVLGKMATRLNLEGAVVHCYYTRVDIDEDEPEKRWVLTTQNSGYNTARSPEGYFQEYTIPNNLQHILEAIQEDVHIS